MTLKINIDQVFRPLVILFYEEYLREIGEIVYIDNGATYHIYKYTKKFCTKVRLLHIIWLV